MKGINKTRKVIIFTVLAMSTIIIGNYSESGAKYYKEVETGLTYRFGLSKLSTNGLGSIIALKGNEVDKLSLDYSVPRNLIADKGDEADKYEIVVDSGCVIKKVNGNNVSASNTYSITYNDFNASNITVSYVCPVSAIEISSTSDFMVSNVLVYEQMTTDVNKFLYTKDNVTLKKSDVLPKPIVGDYHLLTILATDDEATINKKVIEWLDINKTKYADEHSNYPWANSSVTVAILNQYFKKAYTTDIKQFDDSLINGITFNQTGDEYTYLLDESFIANALTDYYYDPTVNLKTFYFSDIESNDQELESVFETYVDKYLYKKGTQEYIDLISYINNYGGISSLIKGTNTAGIPGIKYYKEGRLELQENLMDYVYPPVDKTVTIDSNTITNVNDIKKGLADGLFANYPDVINDRIYKYFSTYDFDITTIARYRKNTAYNDYYIYNLDGQIAIINISSDGDGIIKASASNFDSNSEVDISSATTISIALNYDSSMISDIGNDYKNITGIIDTKYNSNYSSIVVDDLITNYENGKGIYIDSRASAMVVKCYLINNLDHYGFGSLVSTIDIGDDELNTVPDTSVGDDPDKVVSGDTPDDDIPIFDDLVTTEPGIEVSDTVTGDNETVDENPENQEEEETEESEETDDNSKKADTDIEKEFVDDIENLEKLIEDMKEYVGDAEEINEEEEAIQEVSELIETVKDYINEV